MQHLAIDLSASKSQICIRDEKGSIVTETPWRTAELERFLATRPASRVVVESSSEAFAIADMARRCGHQVVVVPSIFVRALGVGARRIKNDRNDARATSAASCQMAELPAVHIPAADSRDFKAACTSREALVGCRTKLINTVRSWMRTQLLTLPKGGPETFPRRAEELLLAREEGLPSHIGALLEQIDKFNKQIKVLDKELKSLATGHPICKRLMTVPGVGPITAIRFLAAVDDRKRFPNAHRLESYFGLTPGENITGFKGHRTGLTKAGQARVRWTLVQAAWTAMRCRPNDTMVQWAKRVADRRGRSIAAVALARKIAGILYAIWRDETVYDPRKGGSSIDS
jgi:transposase